MYNANKARATLLAKKTQIVNILHACYAIRRFQNAFFKKTKNVVDVSPNNAYVLKAGRLLKRGYLGSIETHSQHGSAGVDHFSRVQLRMNEVKESKER